MGSASSNSGGGLASSQAGTPTARSQSKAVRVGAPTRVEKSQQEQQAQHPPEQQQQPALWQTILVGLESLQQAGAEAQPEQGADAATGSQQEANACAEDNDQHQPEAAERRGASTSSCLQHNSSSSSSSRSRFSGYQTGRGSLDSIVAGRAHADHSSISTISTISSSSSSSNSPGTASLDSSRPAAAGSISRGSASSRSNRLSRTWAAAAKVEAVQSAAAPQTQPGPAQDCDSRVQLLIRPISAVQLPDYDQLVGPDEAQLQLQQQQDSILAADAEVAALSGAALEAPGGAAAAASSAGPCWLPIPASLQPAALARLARASSPALGGGAAGGRMSLSSAMAGASSLGSAPGSRVSSARASSSRVPGSSGRPRSPAARPRSHTSCGSYTPVVVTELDQAIPRPESCAGGSRAASAAGQLRGLHRASMPCNLGPSCAQPTSSSPLPWQQRHHHHQQQPSRATSPCLSGWGKQEPAEAAPAAASDGPAAADLASGSPAWPASPPPTTLRRASVSRITSPEPKLPASIWLAAAAAAPSPAQPGVCSNSGTPAEVAEAQPDSIAAARCPSPGHPKAKGGGGGGQQQAAAVSNGSKQHLGHKELSQLLQWSRTY
jgi:hypothetical protein